MTRRTWVSATLSLSAISMLSRVLGFFREQAIAWWFGVGAGVDAYVAAGVIPQTFSGVVTGILAAVFMPVYSAERAAGREKQLIATTTATLLLLTIVGSLLGFVFTPQLVRIFVKESNADQLVLTAAIHRVMVLTMVTSTLMFYLTLLLNAHQQFAMPALHSFFMNGAIIGGLIFFGQGGVVALAWLAVIGGLVSLVWVALLSGRSNLRLLGVPNFREPAFRQMIRLTMPIWLSSLAGQVPLIVSRRLASGLATGSMASLNFAERLIQLPVGVFVTAFVTVAYPAMAETAASGDKNGVADSLASGLRSLLLVMVPASVNMAVFCK